MKERAFLPLVLDTSNIPESDRFEYWREFVSRRLMGALMDSPNRASYQGRLEDYQVDQASVLFIKGEASTSVRNAQEIARTSSNRSRWLLMRPEQEMLISQAGHDVQVGAGDLVLVDSERPYKRAQGAVVGTVVAFPDTLLNAWGLTAADCVGRSFKSDKGWPMLLSAYIGALTPELMNTAGQDGAAAASLVQHVTSLLVQTMSQQCAFAVSPYAEDTSSYAVRKSLYDRMLAWLLERHMEPGLEAKDLAHSFSVSVRYVHKVFAEFGIGRSFLHSLQDIRLERACHFLSDPRHAQLIIAEIAWRCGYDNVSSFGRLFKGRHGTSPGAYRMARLDQAYSPETGDLSI